jgi:hypothetical protein
MKRCTKCGEDFPATKEYFQCDKSCKSGLRPECKICINKRKKGYYYDNHEEQLRINKISNDKYKEYFQKWREEHRQESKEYAKEHYANNREKALEYRRDNYNPEKARTYNQEYYKNNSHDIKIYGVEYYKNNKINIKLKKIVYNKTELGKAVKNVSMQKRRSRKMNLDSTFTSEQWVLCKQYFNNTCCYCGEKAELSQDHFIPLSSNGEYTKYNIVPACKSCNSSKFNNHFLEWYPMQEFYDKQREQKILEYLNSHEK